MTIFHSGFSGISEVELQSQESEDDKADERKTRCETWNPIRKINTIKYQNIPKYRQKKRDIVDSKKFSKDFYLKKIVI